MNKFILLVTLLLLLSSNAIAEQTDAYGPPAPAGFFEQTVSRASSWWKGIKEKIAAKLSTDKSAATASPAPQMIETTVGTVSTIALPPVATQPALVLPREATRPAVVSIPELKFKSTKSLVAVEALPETPNLTKKSRYEIPSKASEEIRLPKEMAAPKLALATIPEPPSFTIQNLPSDTMKLLEALFSWLLHREEEAFEKLQSLALSSKINLIREKAWAFEGWMLQDKGLLSFSALALARGLEYSDMDSQTQGYDTAILETLSKLAHGNSLVKLAIKNGIPEKLTEHKAQLHPEAQAFIQLVAAERAFDRNAYSQARKNAQAIPNKTSWKEQGRYLAATSMFAQKDARENQETAGKELTELFRTVEDPEVFDATAVTLGRIHFVLGNYKAANQYLSQVSKDTNLFIESAIDNAWALLRSGDRNHAVGNMFTLHTPYFDGAYMPESFFIQSLGYQELCQFGDALTAVKQYKTRYNSAFKKTLDFNSKGKTPESSYYDDLSAYLRHQDHKLPGIVLRELARNPEFLRRQKILNNISREERGIAGVFPKSAPGFTKSFNDKFQSIRLNTQKEISAFLKKRALEIEEELKFLTANISLLEYEIFAGAGTNLALQGAQNFAVDEKKANPKREFEEGKEYWPYEDEIWEDELNNFRSKIHDGCAKAKKQG